MAASTFTVERSISVDAPADEVYEQIVDFRNWRNWSVWEILDPEMRRTYVGADAGVDAAYTWSGNRRAGSGSMKITEAEVPGRVAIDLVLERPLPVCCGTIFTIEPEGEGSSRVTWVINGTMTTSLKIQSRFRPMEELLGPDLERGLAQLKLRLEERRD